MSIWVSACDGEMITLNEFLFLYHLKASTHYGYFELLLGIGNLGWLKVFLLPFVIGNHNISSFLEWVGKPCSMIFGGKSQDCYGNGKFQRLVHIP